MAPFKDFANVAIKPGRTLAVAVDGNFSLSEQKELDSQPDLLKQKNNLTLIQKSLDIAKLHQRLSQTGVTKCIVCLSKKTIFS